MKIIYLLFLATTLGFSKPLYVLELPHKSDEPDAPFTVCQALLSLHAMNGKIVRIRGRWDGNAISEDCRTQLTTEGYEWPNSIVLSLTTDFAVRKENPAKWQYDESNVEPAYKELMRLP